MTTKINYSIPIIGFIIIVILFLSSCKMENKGLANVEYFKQGETILADYACPDTLIVVDAIGLNKAMALIEQGIIESSDYSLDSTFHTYCRIK